ncbi:helix-turn-helix domain-containing protein [Chroococcidiopsidales cyanobacterium LEGE 13417]|nr:helix-turn-helix domain-containing protein [Chroococcidiopsidales cyanobacterium LEGE 13417]
MQTFVKQEIETHQKLFGEMLDRYKINAKQLAETAGVSHTMISRFRNGKTDLTASKLMALLENVPQEAREWYLSQLLGVSLKTSLRSQFLSASAKEKAEVLNLMADWIESRDSTETKLMPEAV